MRATTLMGIQLLSLVLIIGSAEGVMDEFLPTIIFILSFTAFALCSIYIERHEKEIIRDTNRRYAQKAKLAQVIKK